MFQPGEEGWGGAKVMIDEGVLEAAGRRADAAYGMHVFSALAPHGTFVDQGRPDAGRRRRVLGDGAGQRRPRRRRRTRALDPVPAAAEMVTALQMAVTRSFDALDPVVVTVGVLRAGTRRNVIPDEAHLDATVRSFSAERAQRAAEVLPRVVRGVAAAHGLEVDVEFTPEYPVTVNDEAETAFARELIAELFGESRHVPWARPLSGVRGLLVRPRAGAGGVRGTRRAARRAPTWVARSTTTPRAPGSTTGSWPTEPRSTPSSPPGASPSPRARPRFPGSGASRMTATVTAPGWARTCSS